MKRLLILGIIVILGILWMIDSHWYDRDIQRDEEMEIQMQMQMEAGNDN